MATISDKVLKSLHVGKCKLYLDGDPTPYVASITIPEISHMQETFDNSSTGGSITAACPERFEVTGSGEVIIEGMGQDVITKIHNANKIYNMNIAYAENNYNPQLAQMAPVMVNMRVGAQFYAVDHGLIKQGGKREISAKFNMFSLRIDISGVTICDLDFISGTFEIDGVDLLAAVTALIG